MAPSPVKSHVDACPDLETLAAYLDGQLTDPERARIAAHIADCETCYFVFTETAQVVPAKPQPVAHDAAPATDPVKWWKTRKLLWPIAAGLAIAASLIITVGIPLRPGGDEESAQMRALVAAVGTDRTIEARLSGGFAYGPLRVARGPQNGLAAAVSPDVRIAAAELEKATAAVTTADGLRARAVSEIVVGDFDRAVAALEEAAANRPSDPRIQSDLAAAYLARAARTPRPDDLSNALAASNRAINVKRPSPEALFNRAVALERLSMIDEARDAWQTYLAVDDRSGWADEARSHLRSLGASR